MQENPSPPPPPAPDPDQPDVGSPHYILIAASVVGGVLLFFALVAVLIYLFRYQLMPDPWKII